MATTAQIGLGSTLKIDNGSSVLTAVGEVIEIGLPNPQTEEVEATHFGSPSRQREFIPGLIDNGEIAFRINWLPGNATDTLINGALTAAHRAIWRSKFPLALRRSRSSLSRAL